MEEDEDAYKKQFSRFIKNGVTPDSVCAGLCFCFFTLLKCESSFNGCLILTLLKDLLNLKLRDTQPKNENSPIYSLSCHPRYAWLSSVKQIQKRKETMSM